MARALGALVETAGRARIEGVADGARLSVRQLERVFARWVGLPPTGYMPSAERPVSRPEVRH